jgi:cellulose synthase/poly-beta-1,6-N-acetylglucosamine synthase-like glycosyltransferase
MGIARTIVSIQADIARQPDPSEVEIVVIADNCTDATADMARAAGSRVLQRSNVNDKGKGFALDFAFERLLREEWGAFVIIDADSVIDPGSIEAIRRTLASGADAIQSRYVVANPNASTRTKLMNVALLAFNVMRPRGRDRLHCSAGILGNGFGLTRETLVAVPYTAKSVVEDLEYHLRLVQANRRVRFVDSATIRGDMPAGGSGAATQRARWDGGRFRMIAQWTPFLITKVFSGQLRFVEPLLELLLLSLAYHVSLLMLMLALPNPLARAFAAAGLVIVAGHVVLSVLRNGGGIKSLSVLLAVPWFILWKLTVLNKVLQSAKSNTTWIRTARAPLPKEKREVHS